MTTRWLWGCLPAFVRVVNALPSGSGSAGAWQAIGEQRRWSALVLAGYEGDAGLVEHELTHVRQWYAVLIGCVLLTAAIGAAVGAVVPGLGAASGALVSLPPAVAFGVYAHGRLYARFAQYRLWAEVAAFRRQLRFYPDDRAALFAAFIAGNYKLSVDAAAVERRLRR